MKHYLDILEKYRPFQLAEVAEYMDNISAGKTCHCEVKNDMVCDLIKTGYSAKESNDIVEKYVIRFALNFLISEFGLKGRKI